MFEFEKPRIEIAKMSLNPSKIERGKDNPIHLYAISLIKKTIKIEKSIDLLNLKQEDYNKIEDHLEKISQLIDHSNVSQAKIEIIELLNNMRGE